MAKRSSTWDNALSDFRPLIQAQGEVGYAYNRLQEAFFGIFNLTMALERPPQPTTYYQYALAIWHVIPSDRVQRDLTVAALKNIPTKMDIKGGIERLEWARDRTKKLAEYRNLIVHAPMTFEYSVPKQGEDDVPLEAFPRLGGHSTKPINMRRLRLIKSPRFWKTLRNDLLELSDYVEFVGRQIGWRDYERRHGKPIPGARHSWPRKPQLPSIRQIDLIRKTIDRQATTVPSRARRRRPSPTRPKG